MIFFFNLFVCLFCMRVFVPFCLFISLVLLYYCFLLFFFFVVVVLSFVKFNKQEQGQTFKVKT